MVLQIFWIILLVLCVDVFEKDEIYDNFVVEVLVDLTNGVEFLTYWVIGTRTGRYIDVFCVRIYIVTILALRIIIIQSTFLWTLKYKIDSILCTWLKHWHCLLFAQHACNWCGSSNDFRLTAGLHCKMRKLRKTTNFRVCIYVYPIKINW